MTQSSQGLSESISPQKEQPWWNRPVTGEGGLLGDLLSKLEKEEVPEAIITQRNKQLLDIVVYAKTAAAIDSDKFSSNEFVLFVKIKFMISKGSGDYEGLEETIRLLQLAINARESFVAIYQTELKYRGYKQQELYQFVEFLLKDPNEHPNFRDKVQQKIEEILTMVKTDEGVRAINSYHKHLARIWEDILGVRLLSLFKSAQLADYSVLKIVADLIDSIQSKHIHDADSLVKIVNNHLDSFRQLKNIINLPEEKDMPATYAIMVQYIALSHQHEISYLKFQELAKVLRKWSRNYQIIQQAIAEYPASRYKLPKEFSESVPGEEIYVKYQKCFNDQKTGTVYIDLDGL
ncbi:MAG: hypothetical protein ACRC6M_07890 [Microcystaceae cyanobacterium]